MNFCKNGRLIVSLILVLSCTAGAKCDALKIWEKENLAAWQQGRNMEVSHAGGIMSCRITGKDSQLLNPEPGLDSSKAKYVHIHYRAQGFSEPTSGQIYYRNENHDFSDKFSWRIPSLVNDGNWHELVLEFINFRGNFKDWTASAPTALRLDIVDQTPGTIDIAYIAFSEDGHLNTPAYAKQARWNFSASPSLQGWYTYKGLALGRSKDGITLDMQQRLSFVLNKNLDLKPGYARYIYLRYRASDLPEKTSGQMFYENEKHSYTDKFCWNFPTLVGDGQWHELMLDMETYFHGQPADWLFKKIKSIRLHLVQQDSGHVEISHFMFLRDKGIDANNSASVITDDRHILISPKSFIRKDAADFQKTVKLPKGTFNIFARTLPTPEAVEAMQKISFNGEKKIVIGKQAVSGWIWTGLGSISGGETTIGLPKNNINAIDCILLTQGDTMPEESIDNLYGGHVSVVKPIESPKAVIPAGYIHAPYWTGSMLTDFAETKARAVNTGSTVSYLRQHFSCTEIPTNSYLQISVDDYYEAWLNGEKVGSVLKQSEGDWSTPKLYDISKIVRQGENVLAIKAINTGGPGGALYDITMNMKNGNVVKVVSSKAAKSTDQLSDNWQSIDYDDNAWSAPVARPAPPVEPWGRYLPYMDMREKSIVECKGANYQKLLENGAAFEMSAKLFSEKPLRETDYFFISLKRNGNEFHRQEFKLDKDVLKVLGNNEYALTIKTKNLPKYVSLENLRAECGIYGRDFKFSEDVATIVFSCKRPAEVKGLKSSIKQINGVPYFSANEKPFYPLIWNPIHHPVGNRPTLNGANICTFWAGDRYKGFWQADGVYNFTNADAVANDILVDNPYIYLMPFLWVNPPLKGWKANHGEEISQFNDGTVWDYYQSSASFSSKQWRKDATIAIQKAISHFENSPYADRIIGYSLIGGVSAEWQGWGCHTSHKVGKLMDYSLPAQKAFAKYARTNYGLDAASIPALDERLRKSNGVFRDPEADKLSIIYDEFYSKEISGQLIHLSGVAKKAADNKKIIGAYFGYSLEFSNMNWAWQMSGHNDVKEVLESESIDFMFSPPSYGVRAIGECGEDMHAFASQRMAGKVVFVDDDSRTSMDPPGEHHQAINHDQTEAILRRGMGRALTRMQPLCFLPITSPGRSFSSKRVAAEMSRTRKAGEYALKQKVNPKAEIAVVLDEDAVKLLSYDRKQFDTGNRYDYIHWNGNVNLAKKFANTLGGELIYYQRDRIDKLGAPSDYMLISSLEPDNLPDYKLWIFLSCFSADDHTKAVISNLEKKGTNLLFVYAQGYFGKNINGPESMKRLTGFSVEEIDNFAYEQMKIDIDNFSSPFTSTFDGRSTFGQEFKTTPAFCVADQMAIALGKYQGTAKTALATKQVGNSNLIFCGTPRISSALLRSLAKGSGVHIYVDTEDTCYANENFIVIHSAHSGTKKIHLKHNQDVVDIYSLATVAQNVEEVEIDMQRGETRSFFVGNADDFVSFINSNK